MARLTLRMGQTRVGSAMSPSQAGYVQSVNQSWRKIERQIVDIFQQFEDVSDDICMEALRPTFEKSQEYCPIASGRLRRSGYIEKTSLRGKPRVEIGYGRAGEPPYTVFVHERVDMRHKPPTRAKFLQAAVLEDLEAIFGRLVIGYRGFMNGQSS